MSAVATNPIDLNAQLQVIAAGDLHSAARADANVTRQGVMNHQTMSHFMDFEFVANAFEISLQESVAMAQIFQNTLPGQVAGLNTGYGTPSVQPMGTGK